MKHLTQFIVSAGKIPLEAGGRKWLMRQPTPEESADGDSAYRIAYSRVLKDRRLRDLAHNDKAEIEKEARIRASAAEAIYMLPLLLEDPATGAPAFDVFDDDSMAEFEALGAEVVMEMTGVYWNRIQLAINEAKKKSPASLSPTSASASSLENGPSSKASNGRPGRKS